MRRYDYRRAVLARGAHRGLHHELRARLVDVRGRLVQEQRLRPQRKARGERDALHLAARKPVPRARGELLGREADRFEALAHARIDEPLLRAAQPQTVGDVLKDRALEQVRLLEQIRDLAPNLALAPRRGASVENYLAGCRNQESEHLQQRGLAAAVRPDDAGDAARVYGKLRDVEVRAALFVALSEIMDFVKRRAHVVKLRGGGKARRLRRAGVTSRASYSIRPSSGRRAAPRTGRP